MKNALVTGHLGFVGSHFTTYLVGKGWNVVGIDIKDGVDCRDYFKESDKSFDLVVHLAAIVGGRESIEGRPLAVADNLSIDSEFFQWCLKTTPSKIVYFSSSAAYPIMYQTDDMHIKLREWDMSIHSPKKPDATYGWSKLTGEFLASFVDNVHIFRPFSGYGPGQDLTYPFPMYIKRAIEKQNPFEVWGTGQQTRDFIHIEDIINAVMVAVENNVTGPTNLGWGRATSFIQLAEMVTYYAGYTAEIVTRPDKPVGCMHRVSDNSKLLEFYTPKITLEEGIERAIRDERV
jgi:nucleoside-diphosphate-sugar epimerase